MTSEPEQLQAILQQSLNGGELRKIVLSAPVHRSSDHPTRLDVRPVTIRKNQLLQFSSQIGNQQFHRNYSVDAAMAELTKLVGNEYRNCHIHLANAEWAARFSKKGVCRLKKTSVTAEVPATTEHNRKRQYLIEDGRPVPFLMATGIMTDTGKIRSKHYDKFRQINRYVEFIRDVVDRLPADGVLNIVDFGSGKSYLTFATHYLLTKILHRRIRIVGLDRRRDVIESCRAVVQDLDLSGIEFVTGEISDYTPAEHVHLCISLHACDTATDDAITAAIRWNTDAILAVPCCHHELAAALSKSANPVLSSHGITHERFAELATDSVRAAILECVGYTTQVLEFIELEHTARNLLIRAYRRNDSTASAEREHYGKQLQEFCSGFGLPRLRLQKNLEQYGLLDMSATGADSKK